jgi:hypothetical protein
MLERIYWVGLRSSGLHVGESLNLMQRAQPTNVLEAFTWEPLYCTWAAINDLIEA